MKKSESIELAGCVIVNPEGHVLLLHRHADPVQWEVPGGKIKASETPKEAAEREMMEELGVHVELGTELTSYSFSQGETTFKYHFFAATIIGRARPQPQEPRLHDECKYLNLGARAIGAIGLSPPAEEISRRIKNDEIRLLPQSSTI